MAAKDVEGYVTVYESTDGGTGSPQKTFWQIFVGKTPMGTKNAELAETARLAIMLKNKVNASYDDTTSVILQIRLQLSAPSAR
jgi:hypothetical protein